MSALQWRAAVEPDMEIQKHVIGRAARANAMAAEHCGHALHYLSHIVFGNHDLIGQDACRFSRDLEAGVADERDDHNRGDRIEDWITESRSDERGDHAQ